MIGQQLKGYKSVWVTLRLLVRLATSVKQTLRLPIGFPNRVLTLRDRIITKIFRLLRASEVAWFGIVWACYWAYMPNLSLIGPRVRTLRVEPGYSFGFKSISSAHLDGFLQGKPVERDSPKAKGR